MYLHRNEYGKIIVLEMTDNQDNNDDYKKNCDMTRE